VTADSILLEVPVGAVQHFATLDLLLRRGIEEARAGHFLSPPTAPEIVEMRSWLCSEVARQAAGGGAPVPFEARTDVKMRVDDLTALTEAYGELGETDDAVLATNDGSVVVAASPSALRLLGYTREELVGRRLIAVMPERFRQAHIAGTTLHATNGRDRLLDVPVRVPMVCADGSEVEVEMVVREVSYADGRHAFVARFEPV
jgi:PAS domain S-box-containing protein